MRSASRGPRGRQGRSSPLAVGPRPACRARAGTRAPARRYAARQPGSPTGTRSSCQRPRAGQRLRPRLAAR
eukprot:6609194-Lingulodinium_polyedra.AAC.1